MFLASRSSVLFIGFLLILLSACTDPKSDESIKMLNKTISQKSVYQEVKGKRIKQLTDSFLTCRNKDQSDLEYKMCDRIYCEYILYQFDSAYHYSNLLKQIATKINTADYLLDSKTKYCQALYNAGYYKEVLDSIPFSIYDTTLISSVTLTNYYNLYGRTYLMMSGLTKIDKFSSKYNERGNYLFNMALQYAKDSLDIYIIKARIAPRKTKRIYIKHAISLLKDSDDERAAILYSMLGKNEYVLGNKDISLKYNSMAAVINIRNATKDALPLINIANVLSNEKRELNLASEYLSIAFKDVSEYGAAQRIQEINTILPVIETERLNIAERNKYIFTILFIVVTLLLIGLVVVFIRTIHQSKVLSNAKKLLQDTNEDLKESNMIKNEYLGHYLVENSELTTLINRMYRVISRNIKQKNYTEISTVLADIWKENENLHEDFDRIFLKIFPNFISEFNNLVEDSAKIYVSNPNTLTPTLRIFALIRLDINDSATISKILNCSLNTVYNYRTRIKNKAIANKDMFESYVKEIGN